jgi:hypothetical protein
VHLLSKEIHYLGHIILADGIAIDLEKIQAIRLWSVPRTITEVKSFMGLAIYYQIFIKGLSNIASPITCLQKKGVKFEWNSKCEERFQQLKYILTSVTILNIAYLDEFFVVCIDTCKDGSMESSHERLMWHDMSPEN